MPILFNPAKKKGIFMVPSGGTKSPTPAPSFTNTKSLDFDGVDDYVDCGSFAGLNSATALTVSVWFKSSVYSSFGRLVNLEKHVEIFQNSSGAPNTKGCFHYVLMGTWGNSFATLGGRTQNGVSDLCDGDWHHLCFVWDGSTTTAIVYEDGIAVQTKTASGTINSVSDTIYIGADPAAANPIQGNADEVALWNTALSPTDVAAVYNSGSPDDLTSLSPIFWTRNGDDATYPTIPDEVGSNDGTMTNMVAGDIVTDVP
jgi:hypothetical protein